MPMYVALVNFTDAGYQAIASSLDRAQRLRERYRTRGIVVHDMFWTTGQYDMVLIVEAPNDETQLATLFEVAAGGTIRTQTFRAFSEREIRSVLTEVHTAPEPLPVA